MVLIELYHAVPYSRDELLQGSASETIPVGRLVPKATAHQPGCVGKERDAELPHPGIAKENRCPVVAHLHLVSFRHNTVPESAACRGHISKLDMCTRSHIKPMNRTAQSRPLPVVPIHSCWIQWFRALKHPLLSSR